MSTRAKAIEPTKLTADAILATTNLTTLGRLLGMRKPDSHTAEEVHAHASTLEPPCIHLVAQAHTTTLARKALGRRRGRG